MAGRLPRGDDKQVTVSVRVSEDLKEQYKDSVDSMSDDLREYMADQVGAADVDEGYPDDDLLDDAYRVLLRHAAPDTQCVGTDTAVSAVAEATKVKSGAVRDVVLKPLERLGYIRPNWGRIVVHPPEVMARAE